jgi:cell division transport system permease protein
MALKNQLHRVRYFCSDAWDEWRHSLAVNLMALATLVSALFVAGLIMLIVTNIGGHVETLRDEVKVEVYLHDGDEAERLALADRLRGRERVERVEYVDKDEALRRYREWAAELANLVGELETNPLPASFEVYLTPGDGTADAAGALAAGLENEPVVEDVRVNLDWLRRLEDLLELARVGGGVLITLVFVAVVFVMGSVLRLAVYARRQEIGIMQLVGATPTFIRGPYLVAGAVQGLVASVLALVLVEVVRSSSVAGLGRNGVALLDLVAARPLSAAMASFLLLLGLLVSLAGSYVSVRQAA